MTAFEKLVIKGLWTIVQQNNHLIRQNNDSIMERALLADILKDLANGSVKDALSTVAMAITISKETDEEQTISQLKIKSEIQALLEQIKGLDKDLDLGEFQYL